jgi:hypothetical protein
VDYHHMGIFSTTVLSREVSSHSNYLGQSLLLLSARPRNIHERMADVNPFKRDPPVEIGLRKYS